jgi:hypothetical protein
MAGLLLPTIGWWSEFQFLLLPHYIPVVSMLNQFLILHFTQLDDTLTGARHLRLGMWVAF